LVLVSRVRSDVSAAAQTRDTDLKHLTVDAWFLPG
jgi:hypothetical protein